MLKRLSLLVIGVLPFHASLAQSPDYFGSGAPNPAAATPGATAATVTPSPTPAAPLPAELAVAQSHYDLEVKQATAPLRLRYAQTLETLKRTYGAKGDLAAAIMVQQEIDRLGFAQSASSSAKEAKVVIWNQHNGWHNNYGSKTLNVALINDGKEVWRQNGIQIPWKGGEDTKVEVTVPYVPTNKLRVEVAETVDGKSGGLAEIEYWWNGRNYARKRQATVSAVWGNSPKCGGPTLTDGITTSKDESVGYWSMPGNTPGWAEVSLNLAD